jgi:hypothetical protein
MMKSFTVTIVALAAVSALAQDQTRSQQTGLTIAPPMSIGGVSPHSFWVPRGNVMAGGIWDLIYSDNLPLVLGSDFGRGMSAQVIVEGRLPANPSDLAIGVESHATSTNIRQSIALWDWSARAWVHMGSDVLGSWDTLAEFSVIGNPLRFSEAGTGRMRAAIGFRPVANTWTPAWQVRVDAAFWTYSR